MTRVLTNCVKNYDLYLDEIDVDSICQYLKKIGKSKEDIITIRDNIDKMIKELEYEIEIIPSEFGLENYDEETINKMVRDLYNYKIKYKGHEYEHEYEHRKLSRLHDVAAIFKIKSFRDADTSPLKLETARAIFLTADQPLSMFNYEYSIHNNPSHVADGTFPEVYVFSS